MVNFIKEKKAVPIDFIQKALKSICNINIYNGNEIDNCRKVL